MDASVTGDAQADVLRAALVRTLLRDGTLHPGRIERALEHVPRHRFLPEVDLDYAYRDVPIPTKIQAGEIVSSSSQPSIMVIMLDQLALQSGQKVLEIGAGTGYNAALLAEIVGRRGEVTTIDLDADIVEGARTGLCAAGYAHVRVEQADGSFGFAERAPYDRIIATVGLGDIPMAVWSQLKDEGRFVAPLSLRGVMKSVAFQKHRNGHLVSASVVPAGFMPFRGVAPLLVREVRLGPDLGLYAWAAAGNDALNTADLYAALQRSDFVDIQTELRLSSRELRNGLNLWLRAHLASFVMLHAEGGAVESSHLPGLVRGQAAPPYMRDRVSMGLWDSGQLALLAAPAEHVDSFQLGIRAWGGQQLADQIVESVRTWRAAGSPHDEDLHLELVPAGEQVQAAATIPMSAGTLVVGWHRRDLAQNG